MPAKTATPTGQRPKVLSAGFAKRLRLAKDDSGQSLRDLAAASDCSKDAVRLYVDGQREPQISTTERLANALNVTPQWLAYGVE